MRRPLTGCSNGCWRVADRPPRILHLHSAFDLGGKEARAVRLMNLWGDRARHVVISGDPDALGARAAIDASVSCDFPVDVPALRGRAGVSRYRRWARYMRGFDLVLTYNWGAMDAVMAHRIASNDEAPERVPDQHVAFVRRDVREHGLQLVDDPLERSWARGRLAPGEPRSIVGADTREPRHLGPHGGPADG